MALSSEVWRPDRSSVLIISQAMHLLRVSLGILIVLISWELAHRYLVNPLLLPSPIHVTETLWHLLRTGELFTDIAASMTRIFVGYVIGCAIGIIFGLLMARSVWVNDLVAPMLELLQPLSPVALLRHIPCGDCAGCSGTHLELRPFVEFSFL
jgi:ABC-type nitrate/sulfonate/bicarbonate transport system permease component